MGNAKHSDRQSRHRHRRMPLHKRIGLHRGKLRRNASKKRYDDAHNPNTEVMDRVRNGEFSPSPLPVFLMHGVNVRDYSLYESPLWGRIPDELRAQGNSAWFSNQDAWGTIESNARESRENFLRMLDISGQEKTHIVAHSKGGLDAYGLLQIPGVLEHVSSVTTLGTPRQGFKIFDAFVNSPLFIPDVINFFIRNEALREGDANPDPVEVYHEFTTEYSREHATDYSKVPGIFYHSFAFVPSEKGVRTFDLRRMIISLFDGENDGIVPLWSSADDYLTVVHTEDGKYFDHGDDYDVRRRDVKLYLPDGTVFDNSAQMIASLVRHLDGLQAEKDRTGDQQSS